MPLEAPVADELPLANTIGVQDLPHAILSQLEQSGVRSLYRWQRECLELPGVVAEGRNLLYSAPTSGGKSLVGEILLLRHALCPRRRRKRKCILVLPFVALVHEKERDLRRLLNALPVGQSVRIRAYTGGLVSAPFPEEVEIAVCTIEKATAIVNRCLEESRLDEVACVVCDEFHMVGDERRGAGFEMTLAKLLQFNDMNMSGELAKLYKRRKVRGAPSGLPIQIVGMSATIQNLGDVARWLKAEHYEHTERPVRLQRHLTVVQSGSCETLEALEDSGQMQTVRSAKLKSRRLEEGIKETAIDLAVEVIRADKPGSVLIFCSSRNGCEKLAKDLHIRMVDEAKRGAMELLWDNSDERREVIAELARLTGNDVDDTLAKCILHGVAYHHAKLTSDEKQIIADAYRRRVILVLVATSTLATGVNLPARRVVITHHNEAYIQPAMYRQMSGRAGRKGLDSHGESFLVCRKMREDAGRKIMWSPSPELRSSLELDQRSKAQHVVRETLQQQVLQVLCCDLAATEAAILSFWTTNTLLGISGQLSPAVRRGIREGIAYLVENNFVEQGEGGLAPTAFGRAAFLANFDPKTALRVRADIDRARPGIALDLPLHTIYLATPLWWKDDPTPDFELATDRVRKHGECVLRVLKRAGIVDDEQLSVMALLNDPTLKQTAVRFVHALALWELTGARVAVILNGNQDSQDLGSETDGSDPLSIVSARYGIERPWLHELSEQAARFCGQVHTFVQASGNGLLAAVIAEAQKTLNYGVEDRYVPLCEVRGIGRFIARYLYQARIRDPRSIAQAPQKVLVDALSRSKLEPGQAAAIAAKIKAAAIDHLREKARDVEVHAFQQKQEISEIVGGAL